jgi:hypothetical protein
MADAGLEVYRQPFTVARRAGRGGPLTCESSYGVLRSPRGDGKECVVLVTPVTLQPFTTGGCWGWRVGGLQGRGGSGCTRWHAGVPLPHAPAQTSAPATRPST